MYDQQGAGDPERSVPGHELLQVAMEVAVLGHPVLTGFKQRKCRWGEVRDRMLSECLRLP